MLYKVLITGDRAWFDFEPIASYLRTLRDEHGTTNLLIIAGGAPGVDTIARMLAMELSIHVAEVAALWATRHRAAGAQRNEMMLKLEPDEVRAFHENIRDSRGTRNCLVGALKLEIPAHLFDGQRTVQVTRTLLGLR